MKAKRLAAACMTGVMALSMGALTACSGGTSEAADGEQVILYSNADDEAVEAMKNALDGNGYEGQYIFQTFGTSELGGKLLAEGTNIEADMVTMSSSTAWLLIQALVSEYGEDGAKEVLTGIYENAGPHIEDSGSGPIKKVRAGEVAVGFGLRHQAVADKAEGLPIDYVDPTEGNFSLTESVAVIDKGDETNDKAMEMAECIIKNGREELQATYPNALYEGEETNSENKSTYPKTFSEPLTAELLEQHQELSEECMTAAQE